MQCFTFRAFRAIDELDTCLKFKEQHGNVLKDYGITNITSNNDAWMYNPNIYCIVAESLTDNRVVGGVRLQVSQAGYPLPVELAIGKMDHRIYELVAEKRQKGGVAELCALWNARLVAGSGISILLIRAGVSASDQLEAKTLLTICADYTLKRFHQVGFMELAELEQKGYPYPNETYTARVLAIKKTEAPEHSADEDRQRIKSLREQPIQTTIEHVQGHEIEVSYNLVIS